MTLRALLILLLACHSEPDPAPIPPPAEEAPPKEERPHAPGAFDKLRIPADDPNWAKLKEGFINASGFYGEERWDDVAARVFGHQAAALRDLARADAAAGRYEAAAARYRSLSGRLSALSFGSEGMARPLRALLIGAAQRDEAICEALARGAAPPTPEGAVAPLRARYLAAAMKGDAAGLKAVIKDGEALLQSPPWAVLNISDFGDFKERHRLRLELFQHALDATDPLSLDYSWGYWSPDEASLQVQALIEAARAPGEDWAHTPARIAARLRLEAAAPGFSVADLGWLPTGDSYIDVAGEPGPMAIGEMEKLGISDERHRAWLEERASSLNQALSEEPERVPGLIQEMVKVLDGYPYGSRFYNIKQARNAGVRQLARLGRYDLALLVLETNYPLHHQDWACPNRQGILEGIEGRLRLLAGDPEARAKLEAAVATGDKWMADIQKAAASPKPR